jgi:multiple sugar transport system substrate-binding protein
MMSHYTFNRRAFLRQATALGVSAASAAVLLQACGRTEATAPTASSGSTTTTVNLYHTIPTSTETFWKNELLPTFVEEHPEYNLIPYQLGVENPTILRSKIKAGGATAPDMAWIASTETGAYAQADLLADVHNWLNEHPTIRKDLFPSLITLSSYGGQVRSLPWMTNNTAMLINLNAFQEVGLSTPSQDPEKTWTWDEFAYACKRLSTLKEMKGYLMHSGRPSWDAWIFHAWLGTNGGEFLSTTGDPNFNSTAGVETMTFLQDLVTNGYTTYSDPGKGYDLSNWYNGKAAIAANGPWNFSDLVNIEKFKFTVVPYPRNKQPATNMGGNQLFVFKGSQQKEACSFAYAEYMLSDEFQIGFNIQSGNLPVTKSAMARAGYRSHLRKYPFLAGWINSIPYGIARSSLPQSNDAQIAFGRMAWDPIILQQANVEQSLLKAANEVRKLKP